MTTHHQRQQLEAFKAGVNRRQGLFERVAGLGMMSSMLIHALAVALAMLIGAGGIGSGKDVGDDTGASEGMSGVELTSPAELKKEDEEPPDPTLSSAEVPDFATIAETATTDMPEVREIHGGSGDGSSFESAGGGTGEAGSGKGVNGTGDGGNSGLASFFGIEAKGQRLVYICDISGSMDSGAGNTGIKGSQLQSGARLRLLKKELGRSVGALTEQMSFYVYFFNSGPIPINKDNQRWILAKDSGKKWALERIGNIKAFGGTEPWGAFELALKMKPRPDAIYFMTDGVFDADVADRIRQANRGGGGAGIIPIHCVTLVDMDGEDVMRKIAKDSGGTYTHVAGDGGMR